LTAVHQYLLHAELCRHWGYERLTEKFQHLYTEEVRTRDNWFATCSTWAGNPTSENWKR
jgi:bacterioferritin (cytochrome b1)